MKTRFYQIRSYDPLTEDHHTEPQVYLTEEAALKRVRRMQVWDDPDYPIHYTVCPVVLRGRSKPLLRLTEGGVALLSP